MNKTPMAQQAKTASLLPPTQGILQRQCACGNHTMAGGKCAECAKNKSGLQRKLAIGASHDPLEQEADRIAEQVMRMPDAEVTKQRRDTGTPLVQRRATSGSTGVMEAPAIVHDMVNSPGRPLDAATRAFYEPRFGHDFSRIRVHSDARAELSADAVSARAYAVGNILVFGRGEYAPQTTQGRSLIAHELAHVVQQRNLIDPDPVLQRTPQKGKTSAGEFVADPYDLTRVPGHEGVTVGHGADITIKFKSNERVDAQKIAFVQTALSIKDGKVHNRFSDEKKKKVAESRMIPSGKPGEGAHIDQMPDISTPLYGMTGSGVDLSDPKPAPKLTEIGWHYKDTNGNVQDRDAMLHDEPDLNSGDIYWAVDDVMTGQWGQQFETAAIAIDGNQKGTFYGTVEWGWDRKSVSDRAHLLDFKVKSKDVPSPVFIEAAKLWNVSVTTDKKETIDLPVDVRVTSATAELWDSPDQRKKIATLAKDTPLGRTAMVDPKGRVWWASVIVTHGKNIGKAGWVKEVELYEGAKKKSGLQRKLVIGASNDPLEREADRIADQVMAAPAQSHPNAVSPHIQRFSGQSNGRKEASPASVERALASSGKPLEPALRHDMEQRFGYDFSQVRVHSGATAEQSAQDVNAHAYTMGHDIVFGAGRFPPATSAGRRLLAHELAHTVQQSGGGLTIQRFVPCTRARMSLEECPKREPGEERQSRRDPMIVEFITQPEVGYLIANFDIGESKLKSSAKGHTNWPTLISAISQAGSQWELWGLSDCHGTEQQNKMLRKQRADVVQAALPPAAAAHIVGSSDASLGDCITDNENRIAREWNRAVLITAVRREMDFEPTEIEGTRPKPKTEKPDTEGCDRPQRDALARAFSLAKEMVRAAIGAIDDESLMKQYFGKDVLAHRYHIKQNFAAILGGLKWGPTFECNEGDSWYCDGAHARVIPIVGRKIHICPSAIALGDDFLARTIVHECAHGFAFVFIPDELCAGGWPYPKDTTDAEDNADCYGEFAGDALAKSP